MFEQTLKNIDDVLWKEAGCTTELDYTEQTSWLLFLKYLDDLEQEKAIEAELVVEPVRSRPMEFVLATSSQSDQWETDRSPIVDLQRIDARSPDTYDFVLHDGSDHFYNVIRSTGWTDQISSHWIHSFDST